jgi:putative ABC transport system permease protein
MAKKYGWKVGDKIPITSAIWVKKSDGNANWTFDIVGIFDYDNNAARSNAMLLHYDYFDEERTGAAHGTVGWFVITIDDPKRAAQIGGAVDALFANSPNETATQTEKENMQSFMKQIGDINFIVSTIIGAVFFTLLFLTGNTMMQSMRERIPEFAVLKTLGFSDAGVAVMVVAEAAILCVAAAVIGLALADMSFPFMAQFLGIKALPLRVLFYGIGLALLLSLVTALPPAWRVRRLSIVDALARR